MNIDGMGESIVNQLHEAGLVKNIADLYALKDKRPQLLALERVGEKSIDNLLAEIESYPQAAAGTGDPGPGDWAGRYAHSGVAGGTFWVDGCADGCVGGGVAGSAGCGPERFHEYQGVL